MAIVDLDSGPSRRPRARDRALIGGLGGAIAAFAAAMWLGAPHPYAPAVVTPPSMPSDVPPQAASVTALGQGTVIYAPNGIDRVLVLPAGTTGVDLFLLPERLTNENLFWTIRSVVSIRGGVGLASVEGPAIVTWTEKGFQYWMVSPSRTTDELIKVADDLR